MLNKKLLKMVSVFVEISLFFVFIACDNDDSKSDSNGETGGTFTLNGIPAKCNGLYAVLVSYDSDFNVNLFGFESINPSTKIITGVKISNRSVSIPLWRPDKGNYVKYMGNDNFRAYISIIENQSVIMPNNGVEFAWTDPSFKVGVGFPAFNFSNGNATKNWNENNDVDGGSWLTDDNDGKIPDGTYIHQTYNNYKIVIQGNTWTSMKNDLNYGKGNYTVSGNNNATGNSTHAWNSSSGDWNSYTNDTFTAMFVEEVSITILTTSGNDKNFVGVYLK